MNKMTMLSAAVCCLSAMAAHAAEGVKIDFLGPNNSLVRLASDHRLVLLPVEENAPEATVNVLVDGNLQRSMVVRMAKNKIDYFVPFDLQRYSSGKVILDVRTNHDRSSVREASDDVCWQNIQLSDTFDTTNREKYRPAFHHTPLYGWMNDPNGMFYKDGRWHLYYQYNPYGSKWQNMTWGHSSSTDLVNWEHHPVALEPNGLGTVFSGSAVVDSRNTAGFGKDAVIAIYTSAGVSQMQSLAHSRDNGETFTVYDGNPVITYEREARDPNMFWNEETGRWTLVLAGALDREMLFYSSADLKSWTLESSFGKGYGAQEGVWECPDLMELPIRGTNEKRWVLICNINPGGPFGGSATQYFVGDFDGHKFTCDTEPSVTRWMDYGKDHYAAVSWSNAPQGRHTVVAWMSNWQYANEVPTMQYRSANSVPRDLELFRAGDGELYLSVTPVPELAAMRGKAVHHGRSTVGEKAKAFKLPSANDGICEIVVDYDLGSSKTFDLTLANAKGEKVVMTYDAHAGTFAMDRRTSGMTDFSEHFPAVTVAPTHATGKKGRLRVLIDRCSIEAFDGDGRFAMTNLVFPTEPYNVVRAEAHGGKAKISSMDIYPLNPNK